MREVATLQEVVSGSIDTQHAKKLAENIFAKDRHR